ncbi:MAG: class I SAM-dependent methyltransferase [Oleiphilaceae bacterium]|nr:class I SAM-dependent methyltransferase [Oleiphilaceae bacterium]
MDMGSGWGTLAIPFARRFPDTQVIGYEVSWFPWITACVLAKLLRLRNLHFYRRDFRQADLSGASVLLCYLMARGMRAVSERLQKDPGSVQWVISHHFALPGWQPVRTRKLADLYGTPIYTYSVTHFTPKH